MASDVRQPAARLAWLDLYRGLAVLVMIETHVCNTFLSTAHWPVEWRVRLDYVNGLVAPAFLFIAGYAYGCGLRRKRAVRSRALPRLMHLAGIAAIGYAMHIPWSEIGAGRWSEALKIATRVDILPCLAIAIAMLVLVDRFFEKQAKPIVAALALATIFAAQPFARWTAGPVALLAFVNQNSGSLFPLFPWVAFSFCGMLASGFAVSQRASAAAISAVFAAALLLGQVDLSPASAGFFFQRLTWIAVLVLVCGRLAPLWSPRIVLFAGRESLAIYVVHLLLISQLVTLGLPRMDAARVVPLFLAILAATGAIAWCWRRFIVARADRARRAMRLPESSARAA